MAGSCQPRRAIIVMASLTWLIKKSVPLRWSYAFLNGRCWKCYPCFKYAPARKRDLLSVQLSPKQPFFLSPLFLGSPQTHSAREQQPLSLAPSGFSSAEDFWFGFGFLWFVGVWLHPPTPHPLRGKLQNQNLFAEFALVLSIFHKKKFLFPWECQGDR